MIDEKPKGSYYLHLPQVYLIDNKQIDTRIAWKTTHQKHHLKAADLQRSNVQIT